jgi:GR25 family glycosyltransferase involved in LPS biosynthesis
MYKKPPIYLINLKHDKARKERVLKQLSSLKIDPYIITAYDGHDSHFPFYKYRQYVKGRWWDKEIFKPGAFACYLSHIKCWKAAVKNNAAYSIIIEDDILINPYAFKEFNPDIITNTFDLIFINSGVVKFLELLPDQREIYPNNFTPLNIVLLNLLQRNAFHDELWPGSFGYIVSKKGANKLLQMAKNEGICMGVDYAMVFNSLHYADISTIYKLQNLPSYVNIYLNNLKDNIRDPDYKRIELDSYIYSPPALISHIDGEGSRINHKIFYNFDVFDYKYTFLYKVIKSIKDLTNSKIKK